MINSLNYPFDYTTIQRKKKALKKELENSQLNFISKNVAILGGSTTVEVQKILELFLLKNGIKPIFYQSDYNKYFEDIILENNRLNDFSPDIIYFHTSNTNINNWQEMSDPPELIMNKINQEVSKIETLWKICFEKYNCMVIQNNFEYLDIRELGNLDTVDIHGKNYFIRKINDQLHDLVSQYNFVRINDINYLSSQIGLTEWHDVNLYLNYKYAMSHKAIIHLSHNIASIINSQLGKSKKCLVLDLDNTLWGGVIGDDGVSGIILGRETASGEAFLMFQQYVKNLKNRGVILSVCSKNELENAKMGFDSPDSILKYDDFAEFIANWNNKDQNIISIAEKLNITIESMVFIDDNPAERDLAFRKLPKLTIPAFENEVHKVIQTIDKNLYFDLTSISNEDLNRNLFYKENKTRKELETEFKNYDDFLLSLNMSIEVFPFSDLYLDRISQLTNKTNQFNLTTKRCTLAEIKGMGNEQSYISFCCRLTDKYGDNGIVTVFSGKIVDQTLTVELWLMSCRVFKRSLENTVFDLLLHECKKKNINTVIGRYIPTSKNKIVEFLYRDFGFQYKGSIGDNGTEWEYNVKTSKQRNLNPFIKTTKELV